MLIRHTLAFSFLLKKTQKTLLFLSDRKGFKSLWNLKLRAFKIHLHTFFTKCKKGPKVWICGIYFKTKKGLSKLLISIILYVLYRKAKHLTHISHAFSKPFKNLLQCIDVRRLQILIWAHFECSSNIIIQIITLNVIDFSMTWGFFT